MFVWIYKYVGCVDITMEWVLESPCSIPYNLVFLDVEFVSFDGC